MLHLLMGLDRLSLSENILREICQQAKQGREGLILIVPEQFSHEAEHRLCRMGGDTISRYAEVLSLSRLADRVASAHGGSARAYLDKGGRVLAMALAAEQVASEIRLYGGVLRRPEFLVDMLAMVEEFQSYCLEPETLLKASSAMQGQFAQKLREMGLLYEAYLAVCARGNADPAGKLLWLREALTQWDWAEGKQIYFDGFTDLTGAELGIMEALLQKAEQIWVSLPTDERKLPMLRPVQETADSLLHLAKKWDVPVQTGTVSASKERSSALAGLLEALFLGGGRTCPASEDIGLHRASSVEQECRQAVLQAKALLAKGARCRDIAVACTDEALYEAPLRAAMETAGLPYYFAGKEPVLSMPVADGVLNALSAAAGRMDYEDVVLYLKSGLPLLEQGRCDRLDCYGYLWNLRGSQWERTWTLHPRGFGELLTPEDEARLAELNRDKEQALGSLFALRHGLMKAKNTGEMVLCFHEFLEALELRERLEEQANVRGGQLGQALSQLYELIRQSLEQMWLLLGDTVRTPEEFEKLYRTVLSQYQVGTIPAGIDQIYVGTVMQMRQKQVRHLLILGATDGSFPAYQTGEGLLTEAERKQLMAQGVSLAPLRADQMDREMSRIYSAMSAPTDSLWMSCAGNQPAWIFRRAEEIFPESVQKEEGELFLDVPSLAAWRLRHGDDSDLSLPQLERWEQSLRQMRDYDFTPLSRQTVEGLYGRQISLSASRIDKYAACRFAFFLAYGLKAQPRRQAKLDPSAFGTFVHEVLEKTVLRVKQEGGFREISPDRLMEIAMEEIDRYAREHFPEQAQREAYLFRRSQTEILDIVRDLGEELRHSGFQPASCELAFARDGQLPPVVVKGQEASCQVSGFVDRVDLYEENGMTYVRVVDYKTGHKDFDYTDILNGAGLQMLIYLFALKEYGAEYYGAEQLIPAGVLYVPARKEYSLTPPMPSDELVEEKHREERRRRGLVRQELPLLSAMEEDPENPRFMPYAMGKDGPEGDLADGRQMQLLEDHVLRTLRAMTDSIASGDVAPDPIIRGQDSSCRFCEYQTLCHMDLCGRTIRPMASTTAEKFWEKLQQEVKQDV